MHGHRAEAESDLMPVPHHSTQKALKWRQAGLSQRELVRHLGLPSHWRGTISRILYGHPVSRAKENRVRELLGLEPLPDPVPVEPCPDCGHVHTGRCNGKDVAQVVCLAPGETVKRKAQAKPRKRYYRPTFPVELGEWVRESGITNTELLAAIEQLISEKETRENG